MLDSWGRPSALSVVSTPLRAPATNDIAVCRSIQPPVTGAPGRRRPSAAYGGRGRRRRPVRRPAGGPPRGPRGGRRRGGVWGGGGGGGRRWGRRGGRGGGRGGEPRGRGRPPRGWCRRRRRRGGRRPPWPMRPPVRRAPLRCRASPPAGAG